MVLANFLRLIFVAVVFELVLLDWATTAVVVTLSGLCVDGFLSSWWERRERARARRRP